MVKVPAGTLPAETGLVGTEAIEVTGHSLQAYHDEGRNVHTWTRVSEGKTNVSRVVNGQMRRKERIIMHAA